MSSVKEIKQGKQFYAEKRYKSAIESFTKAADLCSCHRGARREKCKCKDYTAAAARGRGEIFKEAMHNCQCQVSRTFSKCQDSDHIAALDYRAATFEAAGKLDYARRDAEWLLELAPRRLEGYLRLGKVVRLQGDSELAWKIYSAGIDVGRAEGQAEDPKFHKLVTLQEPLRRRFQKMDIFALPLDIITQIFSYFDTHQLSQLLRVSKRWNRALSSNSDWWRDLCFDRSYKNVPAKRLKGAPAPTAEYLLKIARRVGDRCRSITITHPVSFGLCSSKDQNKFSCLLNASRNITRLDIGTLRESPSGVPLFPQHTFPTIPWVLGNLTQLSLVGPVDTPYLLGLLTRAQNTLETLSIGRQVNGDLTGWPAMPRLRRLRIHSPHDDSFATNIISLAQLTPSLEGLWTDKVKVYGMDLRLTEEGLRDLWPNLRELVFLGRPLTGIGIRDSALVRTFPSFRTENLSIVQYDPETHYRLCPATSILNIISPWYTYVPDDMTTALGVLVPPAENWFPLPSLENLEVFRVPLEYILPLEMKTLLEDAVAFGKLRELAIGFSPIRGRRFCTDFLAEYDWLQGAACIRQLGIHNFAGFRFDGFAAIPIDHYRQQSDALVNFILSFPNLDTLELVDAECELEEILPTFYRVISQGSVKTLYYGKGMLPGARLDDVRALGAKHSVQILPYDSKPKRW